MVYFRPISLLKSLKIKDKIPEIDTINVAPQNIKSDELSVFVNNSISEIVSINKVIENVRGKFVFGYLIQIKKPKDFEKNN